MTDKQVNWRLMELEKQEVKTEWDKERILALHAHLQKKRYRRYRGEV